MAYLIMSKFGTELLVMQNLNKLRYYISTDVTALNRMYAWTIYQPLNFTVMQAGAKIIAEYEDFQSFCKVNSVVNHYRCSIMSSRWLKDEGLFIYEIKANRFLHGMVRAVTGTSWKWLSRSQKWEVWEWPTTSVT